MIDLITNTGYMQEVKVCVRCGAVDDYHYHDQYEFGCTIMYIICNKCELKTLYDTIKTNVSNNIDTLKYDINKATQEWN